MQISCNSNGTIHWTATVFNSGACQTTGAFAAVLWAHPQGTAAPTPWPVLSQSGTATWQPGSNVAQGDFCVITTANLHVQFALMTTSCFANANSSIMAPCPVHPTCAMMFPDVQPGSKFYNELMSLTALKVVSGYADGTFRPEQSMTRGLAVKMLAKAFDLPLETTTGSLQHFSDVPSDSPYFAYVEAAYKKGLVNGYKDGTFKPEQAITRGALVKMVVAAAGWEPVKPKKPNFTDVSPDSPFYSYVDTAVAHGILADIAAAGGSFQSAKEATRGEIAAMVARAMPSPISNLPKSLEALLRKLLEGSAQK